MNETQEKLLEKGVIVLPEDLEHATYEYVLEALVIRPERIVMYCRGDGGDNRTALAIVDLIQEHGDVIGLLPGEANSSHVPIFAACKERYVFPNGVIGIHKVGLNSYSTRIDSHVMRQVAENYELAEERMAKVLAAASDKGVLWWLNIFEQAGSAGVTQFDAAAMIEMGMARPVAEFRKTDAGLRYLQKHDIPFPELTDEEKAWLKRLGYWIDPPDLVALTHPNGRRYFRILRTVDIGGDRGQTSEIGREETERHAWAMAWNHARETMLFNNDGQVSADNKASVG